MKKRTHVSFFAFRPVSHILPIVFRTSQLGKNSPYDKNKMQAIPVKRPTIRKGIHPFKKSGTPVRSPSLRIKNPNRPDTPIYI